MAFNGYGFEGGSAAIGEAEFASIMAGVSDHGILGDYLGTAFNATRVAGSRAMLINAGKLWVPGVLGHLDTNTQTPAASANSSGNPRIDVAVARVDWTANTVTLAIVEGTPSSNPQPPAITVSTAGTIRQNPGTIFELPLRQARLESGDGEYSVAAVAAGERRYWLDAGKIVIPATSVLPPHKPGRILLRGDEIWQSNGTRWLVHKEYTNTGWSVLHSNLAGYSGDIAGRIQNGVATILIRLLKTGEVVSHVNFTLSLPSAYRTNATIKQGLYVEDGGGWIEIPASATPTLEFYAVTARTLVPIIACINYPIN